MKFRMNHPITILSILILAFSFFQCAEEPKLPERQKYKDIESVVYPEKILNLNPDKAAELSQEIRQKVAAKVVEGLELTLWASDSLVTDPIAISIDEKGGIYYTQGTRLEHSEFDIRGHRDWMTASISFQSVEDRRAFLRDKLAPEKSADNTKNIEDLNEDGSHDWRDLLVEKESVWYLTDESGDGIADRSKMFLEDFNAEISDLANGVLVHEDEVFISIGPDLWRTKDLDGDGIADEKESISHGWAVHIGFGAHGMSGVTVGPQGRIYWGIGDIGMNVIDKEGNQWKYPNQGVIVRCDRDGSNFEVFAQGLRNTHEFVFDEYGNLISEDNDGDHPGERERLVYITYGSDSGWRANWQYGKYTDPKNNKYKVWMDERLHIPRWEGQAAYITPPITNYVNGPTGMVYNPGTALGEQWKNHFFIAEFRGSPANSPIHAFTLKPKGASFELDTTLEVVSGLLPTGIRFGPDGALYFADWIDGWGVKEEGRIWKLDLPGGENDAMRKEVQELILADFKVKNETELAKLLSHVDQRIRQKSQFELAKRGEKGLEALEKIASYSAPQLGRIHAIWGLAQMARQNPEIAEKLPYFLNDPDSEIIAQAAKMIGDVRFKGAGDKLIELLKHESLRVQFFAAEALGRTKDANGFNSVLEMLVANNDEDAWLRHGGILALASMNQAEKLVKLKNHSSKAARIAAVVALRRMKHAGVAEFLKDTSEYVVTEAARAINDDFSILAALPALADLLNKTEFENEQLIRRSINANLRVGKSENLENVKTYAMNQNAPPKLRIEAIEALSTWVEPSPLDRVDGRLRTFNKRNKKEAQAAFETVFDSALKDKIEFAKIAAIKGVGFLKLENRTDDLVDLFKNSPSANVKLQVLKSLNEAKSEKLGEVLTLALNGHNSSLRATALRILPESNLPTEQLQSLFSNILKRGKKYEKQSVFTALGKLKGESVTVLLDESLDALIAGNIENDIQLDLIEAVENQNVNSLNSKLAKYQNAKPKDDPIALYREALFGGNASNGRKLFEEHEAAQCTRCHRIWEWGGDAGPSLMGVGNRLSKESLLLSMVAPSAEYSPGYAVAILELRSGQSKSGIVEEETENEIRLKIGKDKFQLIPKTEIEKLEYVPSAMLDMTNILTKREMRDLVAFLSTLKQAEAVDLQ